MKKELKEEAANFFESLKQEKIEKFIAVGFTREQAELLVEELKLTGLGMNLF